jgi:hypothetical protein
MASTTTSSNGATVDNLNVLDTITADNTGGVEISEWQDVANALFPSTNATQKQTIDTAFWIQNLKLKFQVAGTNNYWMLQATTPQSSATSTLNFTLVQSSDLNGDPLSGGTSLSFTANSVAAFLRALSAGTTLATSTGLSDTSLLASLDINSGIGKNVFQATINGQIANIFSYSSAKYSLNGTGSQFVQDTAVVTSERGKTEPANTTNLGAAGAFGVWYTTAAYLDILGFDTWACSMLIGGFVVACTLLLLVI